MKSRGSGLETLAAVVRAQPQYASFTVSSFAHELIRAAQRRSLGAEGSTRIALARHAKRWLGGWINRRTEVLAAGHRDAANAHATAIKHWEAVVAQLRREKAGAQALRAAQEEIATHEQARDTHRWIAEDPDERAYAKDPDPDEVDAEDPDERADHRDPIRGETVYNVQRARNETYTGKSGEAESYRAPNDLEIVPGSLVQFVRAGKPRTILVMDVGAEEFEGAELVYDRSKRSARFSGHELALNREFSHVVHPAGSEGALGWVRLHASRKER